MFGPALTAAHLKMSEAPADVTQLIDYPLENGQMSRFPLLKCGENVFVLPGACLGRIEKEGQSRCEGHPVRIWCAWKV